MAVDGSVEYTNKDVGPKRIVPIGEFNRKDFKYGSAGHIHALFFQFHQIGYPSGREIWRLLHD